MEINNTQELKKLIEEIENKFNDTINNAGGKGNQKSSVSVDQIKKTESPITLIKHILDLLKDYEDKEAIIKVMLAAIQIYELGFNEGLSSNIKENQI